MNDRQIKACVDYINNHAAVLHGVEGGKLDIGPQITPDNVIGAEIVGDNAVLVVDRGIKGSPKYVLNLNDVRKDTAPAVKKETGKE